MTSAKETSSLASAVTLPRAGRREWIGLAVLMLPTLLIVMDLTVLHLAVPHLSADLQPSSTQLLWIVDIYGFMIAGSLITMGTLGDRIGRRKLLLLGASAFGAASVLAAFSTSAGMLIAARGMLGVAGATLMPSTLSLIRNMFHDPAQRTVAIGIWISGFSAGSAVGPLLGGALLENFWWGSVFLLNVPIMVLLLVLGPLLLPEYKDPQPGRMDLLSAALSLVAVLAVIFGLKQIAQDGVGWLPALSIVTGLIVGVVFIHRQRALADPLVDLRLFQVPAFSASLTTYTLGVFVAFGCFLFIAQYLQLVIGLSPLHAGMWSVPGAIASIVGSNLSPRLVRRVRPVWVVAGGLALAAVGLAMLTQVSTTALVVVVVGWVIISLGFGATFTLTADMVVSAAPPERAGAAAALSETGAEFGGALGLAVLGSLGIAVYRSQLAANLPSGISPEAAAVAQQTLSGAVTTAAQFPDPLGAALLDTAHAAFVQGLQLTAVIGTIVMLGLAVLAVIQLRDMETHAKSEGQAEPEYTAPSVTPLQQPEAQFGD